MEIKSIELIKDEYATLVCIYPSWEELLNDIPSHEIESHTDEVATRYAQQFQAPTDVLTTEIMVLRERNEELVEMLEKLYNSDGWLETVDHKKIQSLITKAKEV